MSSYLSNLLTQTTSKYHSLRRTLLSSEDDGDTEDDTHICRVLRAYYNEKGRPLPPWLPPDPNERKPPNPQSYAPAAGYFSGASGRNQYGNVPSQPGPRGNLSDLWDPPTSQNPNAPMQPQSLRNARRVPPGGAPAANPSMPAAQSRPLPSQRAGSYQSTASQGSSRPVSQSSFTSGNPAAGGGTAQDRLRARLWGPGRAGSPGPSSVDAPNTYGQPAPQGGNASGSIGGGNPYDTAGRNNRSYGRQG